VDSYGHRGASRLEQAAGEVQAENAQLPFGEPDPEPCPAIEVEPVL
jgi:hypothetical protein